MAARVTPRKLGSVEFEWKAQLQQRTQRREAAGESAITQKVEAKWGLEVQ
jgi:hypothetical protein